MKKRYLYVFMGFLMQLLLGIAYAWSIFVGPLEKTYGWSRTETSLAFTILMAAFAAGGLLAGMLVRHLGYRNIVLVATLFIGAGFILTAFTSDIRVLYISYGILAGTGIGMIYNAVVSVLPLWFPERQGMITGLLLMGYALSTSLLSPICQTLLASWGPKTTFLLLGILDMLVFFAGSFCMKAPGERELSKLPQGSGRENAGSPEKAQEKTTKEMLRSPRFYLYFLTAGSFVLAALSYLNHVVPALENELALPAASAALAVSVMSLCNGLARPLAGQFIDRKGIRITLLVLSSIYLVSGAGGFLALCVGSAPLMILSACVLLFGYGCQSSSMPAIIRRMYGNQHFSMNYSAVSMVSFLGSLGPSMVGAMQTMSGSYRTGFLLVLVVCGAAVPLSIVVGRMR